MLWNRFVRMLDTATVLPREMLLRKAMFNHQNLQEFRFSWNETRTWGSPVGQWPLEHVLPIQHIQLWIVGKVIRKIPIKTSNLINPKRCKVSPRFSTWNADDGRRGRLWCERWPFSWQTQVETSNFGYAVWNLSFLSLSGHFGVVGWFMATCDLSHPPQSAAPFALSLPQLEAGDLKGFCFWMLQLVMRTNKNPQYYAGFM